MGIRRWWCVGRMTIGLGREACDQVSLHRSIFSSWSSAFLQWIWFDEYARFTDQFWHWKTNELYYYDVLGSYKCSHFSFSVCTQTHSLWSDVIREKHSIPSKRTHNSPGICGKHKKGRWPYSYTYKRLVLTVSIVLVLISTFCQISRINHCL